MSKKEQDRANLIFDRWKADLKEMDRSRANVYNNFELLFATLDNSQISFEVAHQILPKAIKAHFPPSLAVENTYKRLKPMLGGKTKQEFLIEWQEDIEAAAKRAFYSLFNIDGTTEQEEKKFGSMSAAEYKKQRKYAESYPILDWTKINIEVISNDTNINLADLEGNNE